MRELGQYSKANSPHKTRIGECTFLFIVEKWWVLWNSLSDDKYASRNRTG
jgi:hypothetical protein